MKAEVAIKGNGLLQGEEVEVPGIMALGGVRLKKSSDEGFPNTLLSVGGVDVDRCQLPFLTEGFDLRSVSKTGERRT